MLEEFSKTILEELDYRKEARNLDTMRENLQEFPLIVVPAPIHDYSSSKVLTMDFMSGKKITAVTKLEQIELDGGPLAEEVFRCYLKQILVDGFFHADPHPGNVLLTDDKKIALIDLGMVARISPDLQGKLLQLLLLLRLPSELTMLGKTLLNLDQVGRTLDPDFDPNASVRKNAAHLTQQRMLKSLPPVAVLY